MRTKVVLLFISTILFSEEIVVENNKIKKYPRIHS